jgi:hypothetical protein
VGNWILVPDNISRLTNTGLLVEEQKTNNVQDNSNVHVSPGPIVPGSNVPASWSYSNPQSGIQLNIVGKGTENGMDYFDIQIVGTSTAANIVWLSFCSTTASPGQVYFGGIFAKHIGGDNTGLNDVRFGLEDHGGTGGAANYVDLLAVGSGPLGLQRFTVSNTVGGTNNLENAVIIWSFNNGANVNNTTRFAWPTQELNAPITSPIRTTGSIVQRNTDLILLNPLPSFASNMQTIFAQVITSLKTPAVALALSDGTTGNRAALHLFQGNPFYHGIVTSGGVNTNQNDINTGTVATGVRAKFALATQNNDQALCVNGGPIVTGVVQPYTAGSAFNEVQIGDSPDNFPYDGLIERIGIWASARISNPGVQGITTP